jgi:hypothetical protein
MQSALRRFFLLERSMPVDILKILATQKRVGIVDGFDIPKGATIQKCGNYLRLSNMQGHPIASIKGFVPYHRFVLYEHLGRPHCSPCYHCGFNLLWSTSLADSSHHNVNVDHLDCNTMNNHPNNLKPSCFWCNSNRSWAEKYPEFWSNWRRWLRDVPPAFRPDPRKLAVDFGITEFT